MLGWSLRRRPRDYTQRATVDDQNSASIRTSLASARTQSRQHFCRHGKPLWAREGQRPLSKSALDSRGKRSRSTGRDVGAAPAIGHRVKSIPESHCVFTLDDVTCERKDAFIERSSNNHRRIATTTHRTANNNAAPRKITGLAVAAC